MTVSTFAILIYVLFAAVAIVMTRHEQRRTGGRPVAVMAAGFIACLFWPVTALVMLVVMRRAL